MTGRASRSGPVALLVGVLLLAAGCAGPATGPIKGVLVVLPEGHEDEVAQAVRSSLQRYVTTTDTEEVFSWSFVDRSQFEGDFRLRRTILVVAGDADGIPDGLSAAEGVRGGFLHYGYDVWARGQSVYALTADDLLAGGSDLGALSDSLERAYDRHMSGYVYGSFVNTQMSSPARIDSLSDLGFTLDVPKSYATKEWLPDDGFVQFQRELSSESLLLMLSVRWVEEARVEGVSGPDEALLWREEMARRFFFDAALDSVDRARTTVVPMRLRGLDGYLLVGAWRNPEHLNAGAFTSYVLRDRETGTGYMLDFEVYHPHATKEIYLREGWTILNTFFPGGSDG